MLGTGGGVGQVHQILILITFISSIAALYKNRIYMYSPGKFENQGLEIKLELAMLPYILLRASTIFINCYTRHRDNKTKHIVDSSQTITIYLSDCYVEK
jgi:hypothetical protein